MGVILAGTGRVCAFKVGSSLQTEGTEAGIPTPHCKLGGVSPQFGNGCPTDANVAKFSTAFPACLASGNSTDPYTEGDFHCLLVCECTGLGNDCGLRAHMQCPKGARCERGQLKNMAQGVCTFHGEN